MSRFAAIDIGSNSIRLKIADAVRPSNGLPVLNTLKSRREVTRLGEGVFQAENKISKMAMKETFAVLAEMAESCAGFRIAGMRAVATSAVRDAKNHLEFLARAKEILGVPVEVISGPEEADLVHLGVHARWRQHPDKLSLIVDLGGGSAQFINGQPGKTVDKVSRPLGAVRLRELFLKHDPPRKSELRLMNKYIDEKLSVVTARFPADSLHQVIVTSGTAAALVCAVNEFCRTEWEDGDGFRASIGKVKDFYEKVSILALARRRKIVGISKRRAEVIVPGVAVLKKILVTFRLPALTYSAAGVADGIIATLAMRGETPGPAHEEHFHVFLSHNREDKAAVKQISERLKDRGVLPWLDEEQCTPGRSWQKVISAQIGKISSAAVFIGPNGVGPWQGAEMEALLRQFCQRNCPVIPVILPNTPSEPELPLFLSGMTWVDFRREKPDPLEMLLWGITGERPR